MSLHRCVIIHTLLGIQVYMHTTCIPQHAIFGSQQGAASPPADVQAGGDKAAASGDEAVHLGSFLGAVGLQRLPWEMLLNPPAVREGVTGQGCIPAVQGLCPAD